MTTTAVTFTELAQEVHKRNCARGWWDGVTFDEVTGSCIDSHVLGLKIALIHSEVSEMLEGLRKGHADDHLPDFSMETVEAADILIRLLDYAGARNLDLNRAFIEKLAYNDTRLDHAPVERAKPGGKKF